MSSRNFLNNCDKLPLVPVLTGITFTCIPHALYFSTFSASLFPTFISVFAEVETNRVTCGQAKQSGHTEQGVLKCVCVFFF
jgi:hypothetical protein